MAILTPKEVKEKQNKMNKLETVNNRGELLNSLITERTNKEAGDNHQTPKNGENKKN